MVNTYVIYNNDKECIIIDPASENSDEDSTLTNFIDKNSLIPKLILHTHGHVDHLLGADMLKEKYKIESAINKEDLFLVENAVAFGSVFGLSLSKPKKPEILLNEGDYVSLGDETIKMITIPGHSPGSLVFYSDESRVVFTGDVLFYNSIGRTDLPGGSYDDLIYGIKEKLFLLPDDYIVYSGHGDKTSIYNEKNNNPFLK